EAAVLAPERIRRFKPYPEYQGDYWFGARPAHWRALRAKFAVDSLHERTESNSDVPYLGLENVESSTGKLIPAAVEFEPESEGLAYASGHVLFGKLRPYLAKAF